MIAGRRREDKVSKKQIVALALGAAGSLMLATMAHSAEIKVLSTQATEEAYRELLPQFEKASGHKVTTTFTGTLDANKRLAAGETYDLLIMSAPSIDEHIKTGKVVSGSRVDLAKSGVGVGVKAGAAKPDISTTEALKKALLSARSIGSWPAPRRRTPPRRSSSSSPRRKRLRPSRGGAWNRADAPLARNAHARSFPAHLLAQAPT
jgi:ABC-type molybdate transport system substrate-binding protein